MSVSVLVRLPHHLASKPRGSRWTPQNAKIGCGRGSILSLQEIATTVSCRFGILFAAVGFLLTGLAMGQTPVATPEHSGTTTPSVTAESTEPAKESASPTATRSKTEPASKTTAGTAIAGTGTVVVKEGLPDPNQMLDPPTAAMVPNISRNFLPLTSLSLPLSILRPEYPIEIAEIEAFSPLPPQLDSDMTEMKEILPPDLAKSRMPVITTIYGVTCGKTTFSEVKREWGEPLSTRPSGSTQIGVWQVANVGQVEVTANASNGIVTLMVVRLEPSKSVPELVQMLKLESVRGTPVLTPSGEVNGLVFPERGFSFGFTENVASEIAEQASVGRLVIESQSAELYRVRVDQMWYRTPQSVIPDLAVMLALNPNDANAYWTLAQVHTLLGHPKAAFACAQRAFELAPEVERYERTVSKLQLLNGDWEGAATRLEEIVARTDPEEQYALCERAKSHVWLGDLALMCIPVNYSEAVKSYTVAVQQVQGSMTQEKDQKLQKIACDVMLNAYLGGSYAMSLSNWLGRDEALNMWLVAGESVLDTFGTDDSRRFAYLLRTFSIGAVSTGFFDAGSYSLYLEERSQRLLSNAKYSVYQRIQIRWEKALAMVDAAWIFRRHGDVEQADQAADMAITEFREITRVQQEEQYLRLATYLTGRMLFLKSMNRTMDGSTPAVACAQYQQTLDAFTQTAWLPTVEQFRLGISEAWLTLAYQKQGESQKALETADRAMNHLENAQEMAKQEESGVLLDLPLLAVSWRGLEKVYRDLDKIPHADRCAKVAEVFESLVKLEQQ